MNIEDYTAAPTGVLVHKNFEETLHLNIEPYEFREKLWENFKLLVKIANEENNLGENK